MQLQNKKDFILYVNDVEYSSLKYKARVNAENVYGEQTLMTGTIKLNDILINEGPLLPTFTSEYLNSLINLNLKEENVD